MIELRWVEKKRKITTWSIKDGVDVLEFSDGTKSYSENGYIWSSPCRTERVLQYRQVELRVDASGALTPLPNVTWSDWQDVPVVTDG